MGFSTKLSYYPEGLRGSNNSPRLYFLDILCLDRPVIQQLKKPVTDLG
jgi:hypothetical protein